MTSSHQDFNLKPGPPILDKEADLIEQQIDILFSTSYQDVLGAPTYGTDYESCLYDLKMTAGMLEDRIMQDLGRLDLFGWQYDVEASLYQGTERDIALVKVDIYNGSINRIERTYKIS